MKKQKQANIAISQFEDIVTNHKMKEVSPPEGAKKDLLSGKTAMTVKEAAGSWFKTAKAANPSSGFLEVPSEGLKPTAAFDRQMLYKGKKK